MKDSFVKYISLLYRNTNRYFDIQLEEELIRSGQQFFLLRIFENDGISMCDLAKLGGYDKGTVTKAVQKLVDQGYVETIADGADKRMRHLYITNDAMPAIKRLYEIREEWNRRLIEQLDEEEKEKIFEIFQKMSQASSDVIREFGEKNHRKY